MVGMDQDGNLRRGDGIGHQVGFGRQAEPGFQAEFVGQAECRGQVVGAVGAEDGGDLAVEEQAQRLVA